MDCFEDLLPELLFYFVGSGHSLHAKEVMEFLQLIWHETTPKVKSAILRHGILVNQCGKRDSLYPIDLGQEFNNHGLKDLGPPPQNASWEQYAKISHVIPFLQNPVAHVEDSITGLQCSHIHKNPKHEIDVQVLIENHQKHQIHQVVSGCKTHKDKRLKMSWKMGSSQSVKGTY
ncbi:hypothetical protein B0J17DRAFT_719271 [Rhizoctonia solani]|nr:hypothetical protein B0J17DRAFT_719271 [Rhizoctonia solani]